MTVTVLGVVLLAAALHATWNAIVKGGGDTLITTVLVVGTAALIAMAALPFLAPPAFGSWAFIAVSAIVHVGYFVLIAQTYRIADMSETYPIMRGTAPLLIAWASAALLGEQFAPLAWFGIATICAGILATAVGRRRQGQGILLALLNAAVIATYTLTDGTGVRRSGTPLAYSLWMFFLTGVPLAVWALADRREALRHHLAERWYAVFVGGVGTVASYTLVLWAMTAAPLAIVAALRETAILFATAISGLVLKERIGVARVAGACIIAAGVVALRLA